MAKLFLGNIKVGKVKLGTADVKLFLGSKRIYPLTQISGAVVTCDSTIYNGSNQVAHNIVVTLNGNTLIENTDYIIKENSGGTNVGSYSVVVVGTGLYDGTASGTFVINKVTPTVTAPTAKVLTYNGSAQALANEGSTDWGTIQYCITSGGTYSTSMISGTNAGSYDVWYKVVGNSNINDVAPAKISVSIAKANPSYTAPTATSPIYNTSAQALLNAGTTSDGTIQYSSNNSNWSTTIPTGINAGNYTSYWRIVGDANHNDKASASISTTISPKTVSSPTITLSPSAYTYNGNACEPTPTVKDGNVAIASTEYSVSYSNNINAGTGTVTITDKVGGNYTVNGSKTFTINKVTPTVTAPTPKTLVYNGSNQVLANAGSTNYGTLQYCLNNSGGTYSTTVPSASEANITYKVWYKVVGNSNVNDVAPKSIDCFINEREVTGTITLSPTAYTYNGSACQPTVTVKDGSTVIPSSEYTVSYSNNVNAGTGTVTVTDNPGGDYHVGGSASFTINKASGSVSTKPTAKSLTYNGNNQALVDAGSGTGTMMYKLDSGSWGTSIPVASTAGNYTVYYKASASTNYNESASGSVACAISKATGSVTINGVSLTYNGSARNLATVSNNTGTMHYSTNGSSWSTSIPTSTNVGSWKVYWYMDASTNYNGIASASSRYVSSSIGKANQSAPTATGATVYYHNTATATASGGGGQGTLTWTNGNTRSATGSQDTYAYWAGNSNYNASPNSNKVTLTVNKATDQSVTVTRTDRTYNGSGQVVASATSHGCTFYLGFGSSSSSAPSSWGSANSSISQTNAGTYYIWYKATADGNHSSDISATYAGSVTIGKASQSAPTATGATTTYNTTATATASGGGGVGSIEWSNGNTQTSVGSKSTQARWSGNSNYNASPWSNSVTVQMNKAAGSVTINGVSLTYNGNNQNLATVSGPTGTMHYSTNGTSWSTSIPQGKDAGSWKVYWYMDASTNYNGIGSASTRYVSSSIGKANQSAPTATGATTTYNTTATATASGGGGVGSIEWSNGNTQTSVGSKSTQARWTGNSNYNASPWSNSVTVQMNKAAGSVTINGVSLTYNGNSRNLATVSNNTGSMHYSTNGTSWSTSIPTGKDVGSWKVYWYMDASTNYNGIASASSRYVSSSIGKASGSVTTKPTAKTLTYNGNNQALVNAGSGTGTMMYKLDSGSWGTSIPVASTAGNYTVYYKASASTNYNESASGSVACTISKAAGSVTTAPVNTNYTYNGTARAVASAGSGTGTMYYRLGTSGSFYTTIPTMTNAGSNTLYYYAAASTNYNQSATGSITVTVQKASQNAPTATGATVDEGSTATASASGGGGQGTLEWSNGSTRTAVGSQTTKARWAGNTNYNASAWSNEVTLTVILKFVDLGLPSGRKWAVGNIIKSGNSYKIGNETDRGAFFSWGNIVPHFSSNGSTIDGYSFSTANYASTPGKSLAASISASDAAHDAPRALLGSPCHLPTTSDTAELKDNTTQSIVTINGVKGCKFTSKKDSSKYVFFPFVGRAIDTTIGDVGTVGHYWTADYQNTENALRLRMKENGTIYTSDGVQRDRGISIRAVK